MDRSDSPLFGRLLVKAINFTADHIVEPVLMKTTRNKTVHATIIARHGMGMSASEFLVGHFAFWMAVNNRDSGNWIVDNAIMNMANRHAQLKFLVLKTVDPEFAIPLDGKDKEVYDFMEKQYRAIA